MKNVATIIAPENFNLNEMEINSIVDALQDNGAYITDVKILSINHAADIFFDRLNIDEAREILTHLLSHVNIDFAVQSVHGRRKKLLISDMDSTIINQECIDELAGFLGIKEKISAITERAMNGELDFPSALRERVALLKGLGEDKLQECFDTKITLMKGAKELVQTMRASGAKCVLVSGGFTFFTSRIKDIVGFHTDESNILEMENGALTGKVRDPILDAASKLRALEFYIDELGITSNDALAVGDGANDLPMIKHAGLGIAYHAKPKVRAEAKFCVNNPDLKSILYIQGYNDKEIVA
jgi:phosphoserine phosphatase